MIYENNKSLDEQRKVRVASYFNLTQELVVADFSDLERANALKELGFPDMDALHVALAEKSRADCFVTCDDDIIKIYRRHKDLVRVNIVSLIELVGLEVR